MWQCHIILGILCQYCQLYLEVLLFCGFSPSCQLHPAIMADKKQTKEICTIFLLCMLWYAVSSTNNVIGKMVLNEFPYPMTMTMVQLLSITLFSGPLFNLFGIRKYSDIPWQYYLKLIVPLALGKFVASVFSHVSIWKVPVSYAHTGELNCLTFYFCIFKKIFLMLIL